MSLLGWLSHVTMFEGAVHVRGRGVAKSVPDNVDIVQGDDLTLHVWIPDL